MAGIYIHIPFCRQKCYYCDFYKTDRVDFIEDYLSTLFMEMARERYYLSDEIVETIYFGGGTPSVLSEAQLKIILKNLYENFVISPVAEITFEANPDDLDNSYLQMLRNIKINRLSIGIQAFQDEHLKKMNRRHNAQQAAVSVINAKNTGFDNISVDLIYGIPDLTEEQWKFNLQRVFELPVDHLSAYHLTFHEDTIFHKLLVSGLIKELSETESLKQYKILTDNAFYAGFEQYEISNFAKDQKYSKHNTAYWTGKNYLGLGPSAHSYNGVARRWNFSDLSKYIKSIKEGQIAYEEEILALQDRYNEYIITNLRTIWGVSLQVIENNFGSKLAVYFFDSAKKFISSKKMVQENEIFKLTQEGLFISDNITAALMFI